MSKNVMTNKQVIEMLQDNPECLDQPFRLIIWSDDVYEIPTDTEFCTMEEYTPTQEDWPIKLDGNDPELNKDDYGFIM